MTQRMGELSPLLDNNAWVIIFEFKRVSDGFIFEDVVALIPNVNDNDESEELMDSTIQDCLKYYEAMPEVNPTMKISCKPVYIDFQVELKDE